MKQGDEHSTLYTAYAPRNHGEHAKSCVSRPPSHDGTESFPFSQRSPEFPRAILPNVTYIQPENTLTHSEPSPPRYRTPSLRHRGIAAHTYTTTSGRALRLVENGVVVSDRGLMVPTRSLARPDRFTNTPRLLLHDASSCFFFLSLPLILFSNLAAHGEAANDELEKHACVASLSPPSTLS